MKKIFLSILLLIMSGSLAFASDLNSVIKKSPVSKNATVSVSVRKLGSDVVVYENESNKLLNPASTMKAFTTPVIINQLGDDYSFKTQIYKEGNDIAYLKLSADPMLTSKNMRHLIRALRNVDLKQPQKFYIDDTVVDNQEFGIGWQWDDEVSPFMPKYSRYNLDGNVYSLSIEPSSDKKSVKVSVPNNYNVAVVNRLKFGAKNNIVVNRNFWEGAEKITLNGTVNSLTTVSVPVYNQKRYFLNAVQNNMNDANVRYYGTFESKKVPAGAKLVQEYVTPINGMYSQIMSNSNNLVSETLFKIAGGKYLNSQGSTYAGIKAFEDYYKKLGVDTSQIVIVDASGVSRNDLLSTDWMTKALNKIAENDNKFNYKERFNKPNEGTMVNRLFDLRDYLWTKTGTLANTSALTGYITTKNGNDYVFAIIIQNTNLPISESKKLEDEIVNTIYKKY